MNKTPQEMADKIYNDYYTWTKILSYSDEEKILNVIAIELSLISAKTTLNSHNTKNEILYWSKVKNLLKGKLLNGKL